MGVGDVGLVSGGTQAARKRVDHVDDGSQGQEMDCGSQTLNGHVGHDFPRLFAVAVASVRGERALAQATFAEEFYALLFADPTPRLLALKRTVDIVLSAAAMIALLPLFAILAALIKLTTAGPVFFEQPRAGCQGRIFQMLNFLSLFVNS